MDCFGRGQSRIYGPRQARTRNPWYSPHAVTRAWLVMPLQNNLRVFAFIRGFKDLFGLFFPLCLRGSIMDCFGSFIFGHGPPCALQNPPSPLYERGDFICVQLQFKDSFSSLLFHFFSVLSEASVVSFSFFVYLFLSVISVCSVAKKIFEALT